MKRENKQNFFSLKAKNYKLNAAFTLVEMIVAIGVFSVIMTIAVSALLSIVDADKKAENIKSVMNNLNFALENITRNARVGSNYHCGLDADLSVPKDCANTGDSFFAFRASDGATLVYGLQNGQIVKSVGSDPLYFVPLSAPEVSVVRLSFYVDGSKQNDKQQPRVLITVGGMIGRKQKLQVRFDLEAFVSQRLIESER